MMPSQQPLDVRGSLLSILLVFSFAVPQPAAAAQDEIRAGRSQTLRDRGAVSRVYADSVTGTFGQTRIRSDSARVRTDSRRYLFVDQVVLEDGHRRIRADRLVFDSESGVARFTGEVVLADRLRRLFARQVNYDSRSQELVAEGETHTDLIERGLRITADAIRLNTSTDEGIAAGNVHLLEPGQKSLEISCDSLILAPGGRQFLLAGRVAFLQAETRASSKRASYRVGTDGESEAALMGTPVLSYVETRPGEDAGSGSAEATGDSARVEIQGGEIHGVKLLGRAHVSLRPSGMDSSGAYSVTSTEARLVFAKGRIDSLLAAGSAALARGGGEAGTIVLSGDQISISWEAGDVRDVVSKGMASLRYEPAPRSAISRVEGAGVSVRFSRGRVATVRGDSQAVADHLTAEGERSRLSGDQVVLQFREGDLVSTSAEGGVQGQYAPNKEAP